MRTKKRIFLPLLTVIAALCMSIGISGIVPAKSAYETTVNKNTFASYFTAVGDDGLVDYVNDISYGTFTNTNFSGGGVMVQTRNKTAALVNNTDNDNTTNPMLINFPSVKYSAGAKFDGVVDISDNTASDTLIELAFPGTNDNYQNRGFKVIIEDALNPNNYIALFVWSAYGNTDATGGSVIAAAGGTWEKTEGGSDVYVSETGFDTNNYNGNAIFSIVGSDTNDGAIGGTGKPNDGCYLNTAEYGHTKTSVNFSRTSANSIKVQFDNANGSLSVNGVHIRDFKNFSADDTHYFPGFTGNKVKLSVGIIRTTRRSTDEFTRFCIMNIDGNDFTADGSNNVSYSNLDLTTPSYSTINKDLLVSNFTPVGDGELVSYVNNVSYGTFTNTNFSGAGVMVQTRNKTAELVSHTENDNGTNPPLINFPSGRYSTGVKFNGVVDISDNTASTTLIELAFPGTNDNWQNKGFKIIIEDASNPNNYIALFVWAAYSNWDATQTKDSIIAAAAGTWEKTESGSDVFVNEAGFDTNNYKGNAIFSIVGDDLHDGAVGGDGKPSDGCYLNTAEYGHTKTQINFSRTSANSIKVQFDNANGTLSINGVHIRDFKNFSADDTHYFPGFTDNKVKLSVGIMRTTKRSTDEFTRFCIMNIDGNSFAADGSNNVSYYGIENLYDGNEDYVDASSLYLGFSKVGDTQYVNSLSYGEFTGTYINGGGLMVETRNQPSSGANTSSALINLPSDKYAPGVKLDSAIDISDNTASDTLIELAFPGTDDYWQTRGIKIIIEDATTPGKYIALFIMSPYANGDATGGSMVAAATGTWEETTKDGTVYISEAAFDTENYSGGTARLVKVGDAVDGDFGEDSDEGCYLNTAEHGHTNTSVNFSRTSANTIKVQFDYANGTLSINGVHVRDFKRYAADGGSNYFDGFTDGKVKVSVGVFRSVRKNTAEFTRFCIMNIDGISLQKVAYGSLANKIINDGETLINYKTITDSTTGRTFKVVSGDTCNVGELFDMADYNKYVVGYMVGEDLHSISELTSVVIGSENLTYDIAYAHFWTTAGAWVRLGTRTGLRFKGWLRGQNQNIDETVNIVSEFGMLVAPTDYIEDHEFTVENVSAGYLKKVAAENYEKDDDNDTYFYITMTDIQAKNIARAFSVRSYVKVTYYDSTEAYFYASYNETDNSRSAYDVALAAYNDTGVDAPTAAEKTFLDNHYLNQVVEINGLGEKKATGSADYTIDSVSYSSSGNIMYMTVSGANGVRALSWDGTIITAGEGHVPDDTNLAMYEQDGKLQIALQVKRKETSTQSKNIISTGNSDYKILIPNSASTTLNSAAQELQDIISDSYDVTLPITDTYDNSTSKYISLGNTAFRREAGVSLMNYTKEQGGFKIKSYGDGVVIYAEDDYSVYYGIYRFLEENFGYKYYAHDCQVINSGSTQSLKYFDYEDYPDIKYRSLVSTSTRFAYFESNTQRDEWVAAATNNIPLERSSLYNNVHLYDTNSRYVRNNWYTSPVYNSGRYDGGTPFAWQLDDQSLLTYFLPYDSTWNNYNQATTYGASHDSWYVKESGEVKQICFSKAYNNDNGMYDIILDKLKAVITDGNNAYSTIFEIGIGDNSKYCTCSACSSYGNGKSDVYLRFINKLAGDIKDWQAANCPAREIYLMAYAYMAYTLPPTVQTAADNVIVRICPYTAYYDKAYNNSSNYNDSVSYLNSTSWKSIFDGWYAKAAHLGVWDYRSDFTDYLEPFPFWKQLENNIEYFKSLGVMEVMAQGIGTTMGNGNALFPFEEMDNYVRSRMMWDTYLSYNDLMNEFIDAYYGAAATYVKNYISAINTAYGSTTVRIGKDDVTSSKYSSSWVNTVKGYFTSAYAAVSGNAEITRRLDYLSLFYRYLQIKFSYSGADKTTFKTMCNNLGIKYVERDVLVSSL
nr:DUF4838 domain-containing protein [Clostridia bacterium]